MLRPFKQIILRLLMVCCALLLNEPNVSAQSSGEIKWLSFSQLNDSLQVNPKKVFVNFYADWCVYCKEMDRTSFANEKVISVLNQHYYAVKMNIESRDTVLFGDQIFVNRRPKKVNPVHEIALLMAGRKNRAFSLPAFVVLNNEFVATARYFQFLDASSLVAILTNQEKSLEQGH